MRAITSGEHGDHSHFSQHSVFFKNTVIRQDAIFFSGASENKNGVWVVYARPTGVADSKPLNPEH